MCEEEKKRERRIVFFWGRLESGGRHDIATSLYAVLLLVPRPIGLKLFYCVFFFRFFEVWTDSPPFYTLLYLKGKFLFAFLVKKSYFIIIFKFFFLLLKFNNKKLVCFGYDLIVK